MADKVTADVILDGVSDLLEALGVTDVDDVLQEFVVNSTMERIRNKINSDDIPEALYHMCVRVATGTLLQALFDSGKLDIDGLDFSAAVSKIQEGKIDITLASGEGAMTADQKAKALISALAEMDPDEIYRHRRLVW